MAVVATYHNPFTATRDYERHWTPGGVWISDLAPKTKMPFICLVNGKAVLRKDWDKPIADRDLVCFVVLPQGGGSNPLRIVAMLGVMIMAAYLGPVIAASSIGSSLGITAGMATSIVGMVGSALVTALIPAQTASSLGSYKSPTEASPTYSIQAQGNSARLGEAIPVQYGRLRVYPDFAASPYVEYNGNEQYLYELFCIGLGEYDIEAIRIEDTDINNFEEVETEIVNPGEELTLFPANVETSNEVSGQELLKDNPIGPFVANQAGTTANRLAVDVVCSRGLYSLNKKGKLQNKSITFKVMAQEIDDIGQPDGNWVELGTHTITAKTTTPQRFSYEYEVENGRYQVKLERTDVKDTGTSVAHELDWTGLKAYLVDEGQTFPDMTLLAVKIRATNNISTQASKKVNVICTRKLKTWTPGGGWSHDTLPNTSIAWAFADACKADYGAKLSDQQIDLQALYELDQVWQQRGDTFNYRVDSKSTVWEVLQVIAKAGRAKPYRQGGMVRIFRDAPQTVPSGMFTMNNIVKDSFSVDYLMPTDDTADAVKAEYFDERIWQWKTVEASMPDSDAEEPVTVKLLGVTNRDQAWREAIYMAACNRYRRKTISLSTEMEGFIPTMGDLVWVSHDMPQWGQSSVVRSWNAQTRKLTVSEPLEWQQNATHKIILRKKDGTAHGPITVTQGSSAYELVLPVNTNLGTIISTGETMEPTYVSFGWDETWTQPARVLSIKPSGAFKVAIELINEDNGVHVAENGEFPEEVIHSQLPGETLRPVIEGLIAKASPRNNSQAVISWKPAAWANLYLIEQSADLEHWTRCGETAAPNYTCAVMYGKATYFRVCAVGMAQGPWAMVAYAAGADYMWDVDDTVDMWHQNDANMWSY